MCSECLSFVNMRPLTFGRQSNGSKNQVSIKLCCLQHGAEQFVLVCLHFFPSFVFIFQLVGQFIARAVSDQILSKSYIEGYKGRVDCEYTRYVIVGRALLAVILVSCFMLLFWKSLEITSEFKVIASEIIVTAKDKGIQSVISYRGFFVYIIVISLNTA